MKNLSHLREKINMVENALNFDGIVLNIQPDQTVKGESQQASITRTVEFFTIELPERLLALIEANPSISSKIRGHLRLKKMDVPLLMKVTPSGEIVTIYEQVSQYFFDESVIDLLTFITNEILEQTRFEIKNKQRRILILLNEEEDAKARLKKTLIMHAWQNLAQQIPPPPMTIKNYNMKM